MTEAAGPGEAATDALTFAWAGALIGVALGGFFDGILLHQILQWHHLLSQVEGIGDLSTQVVFDGLFHLLMYALGLVGLWLLWRARGLLARPGHDRRLCAWVLIGFGGWHVADAVLSHWLLGIHRIRDASPVPLVWDLLWFVVFGVLFIAAGVALLRRGGSGTGGRRAAAGVALVALIAGPLAARPASDAPYSLVVFLPGTGFGDVVAAAEAVGGHIVWSDASATVWAIAPGDGHSPTTLYRHGAMLVSNGPLAVGCLSSALI